ncbi:negative regulator for alginate biosynthesis MucB [Halomonas sp. ZH2S]|uniref:Negative regulator for alginate biosynthesis MucB n=1 Tax=Vreelandella zhuhanensis TaxID=2684210 RepID=A0A7X3KQA6_9GAMM|nr:MucB/RseB C-terminal domain-containing protein [Halomonas zhuhanensis]MWJ26757.1 negative regulator for alginate biosynthesis MucB [Halomonas zhuhanensis]
MRMRLVRAVLTGIAVFIMVSQGVAAQEAEQAFDCEMLREMEKATTEEQWLERTLWASHCYIFQARAVNISDVGVRTLALSHQIQDGLQQQVVQFLDGPSVNFERQGRVGLVRWAKGSDDSVNASPTGLVNHINDHYRLSLMGEERIAGRQAVRLDITPHDDLRFAHRWWLDKTSGLVLKQVLVDHQNRLLETFQITQLQSPRLYEGKVKLDEPRTKLERSWRPQWLPPGFVAQPVNTHSDPDALLRHQVFSDGLAAISIFVEPLAEQSALAPGRHRLGVSIATVHQREHQGDVWQLVVIGEVPVPVLERVAQSIELSESVTPP